MFELLLMIKIGISFLYLNFLFIYFWDRNFTLKIVFKYLFNDNLKVFIDLELLNFNFVAIILHLRDE